MMMQAFIADVLSKFLYVQYSYGVFTVITSIFVTVNAIIIIVKISAVVHLSFLATPTSWNHKNIPLFIIVCFFVKIIE
jgi:hypothetical protein